MAGFLPAEDRCAAAWSAPSCLPRSVAPIREDPGGVRVTGRGQTKDLAALVQVSAPDGGQPFDLAPICPVLRDATSPPELVLRDDRPRVAIEQHRVDSAVSDGQRHSLRGRRGRLARLERDRGCACRRPAGAGRRGRGLVGRTGTQHRYRERENDLHGEPHGHPDGMGDLRVPEHHDRGELPARGAGEPPLARPASAPAVPLTPRAQGRDEPPRRPHRRRREGLGRRLPAADRSGGGGADDRCRDDRRTSGVLATGRGRGGRLPSQGGGRGGARRRRLSLRHARCHLG